MQEIVFDGTFAGWRRAARDALRDGRKPAEIVWHQADQGQAELGFLVADPGEAAPGAGALTAATAAALPSVTGSRIRVSPEFLELAAEVACYRDDSRWALLYGALWRLTHGEPHLLEIATDPDVHELRSRAKAVRRDIHKMRAFVRFRRIETATGPWFVAWFEPQHLIVEANAAFFRDRFASMCWSILTPDHCVHWDVTNLTFTPGVPRSSAPPEDAMEELWKTYYASIFNPARIKVSAMTAQMPRHYWKNLPEAALIPSLLADARPRADAMLATSAQHAIGSNEFTAPPLPAVRDLPALQAAARTCRACPLWRNATCTVFGTGPANARIVFVGEQPGDQEDKQGLPFVGPAGQLLNRAFAAAGIDRSTVYLTNAVKHFKWEPRGKTRLHQRPNAKEVAACRPWLEAELHALRPELLVCLGATAARSVVGRPVAVMSERGTKVETEFGAPALITLHPSALLRLPPGADPEVEFGRFVADLKRVTAGA